MPRFILFFILSISLYWLLARPLIMSVVLQHNVEPAIEDAQRDVAIAMILLDELEQHISREEMNALISENNSLSNIPFSISDSTHTGQNTSTDLQSQALLDRIEIFNFDNLTWAFVTKKGNHYQFGPTTTISTMDQQLFLMWFLFYLGFVAICLVWMLQWRRRVNHLNSIATDVAHGNLSVRANEKSTWSLGNINRTFNHMMRKIESLVASQRFLTNSVAHELRTPLSRMRFIVESLPEHQQTQIKALNEELDELDTLINDVMTYARSEYQSAEKTETLVNISKVIKTEMDRHSVRCSTELDESLRVLAQAGQLEQIISNLITNAIKYGTQPTHISVTKISKTHALLTIEDEGPGIPEALHTKIFEPFFRGSKKGDGHGFGLAIVKQHIAQLGGKVSVENTHKGGARFMVELPLYAG